MQAGGCSSITGARQPVGVRSYGRAHVYSEQGELVASYVQENMIRAFAEGKAPAPGTKSAH